MRLIPMLLALALAAAAAPAWAQPVPADVLTRVAPAVLRVRGAQCGADDRSGSGFAWEAPGRVVTALHVVSGCRQLFVHYQGIVDLPAHIDRVLLKADLALLSVANPPAVGSLATAAQLPAVGETVEVYGYPLDQPTRSDAPLYVTDANRLTPLLRDAVGDGEREQIRALGIPSLDTEVLRVDGNLLPGHSGAPIINHDGRVVAVGSGGLQRGTVGIGWAVRARYLAELAQAPEGDAGPALAQPLNTSFATVTPGATSAQVQCGELTLVRTRTMALSQLVASSDDPGGLFQLAASTGEPIGDFAFLQFDVWTETRTGAGIAVPGGAILHSGTAGCHTDWPNGDLSFRIAGTVLHAPPRTQAWQAEVERLALGFDQQWMSQYLPYLTRDPRYSYAMGQEHRGGMEVNRKFLYGQQPNGQPPYAVFENLMAKGEVLLAVSAIDRRYVQAQAVPRQQFLAWVAGCFAVHLSTFPP